MTNDSITELPRLIADLFRTVDRLNLLFPGRPFTPDGHLVGSIGEVVAAYVYDLLLEPCSNQGFDARTADTNQTVEVKLTLGNTVSISSECEIVPDLLLVIQLNRNTGFREVYNGPFPADFCSQLTPTKRRVIQVGLNRLQQLCPEQKTLIPACGRSLNDLNRLFPNLAPSLG